MLLTNTLVIYLVKHKTIAYLFILSSHFGWGLFKINKSDISCNRLKKSVISLWYNQLFGLLRNYKMFYQFKGMGFKIFVPSLGLIFKIGYSHRIFVAKHREVKYFFIIKKLLFIQSRNANTFMNLIHWLRNLKHNSIYLKKGIYIKGFLYNLKMTSKKSKF